MNTKHTPGPWRIFPASIQGMSTICEGISRQNPLDGHMINSSVADCATKDANLIATAPEMYELLSRLNTAFYAGSNKDLRAVFAETKPLLRKARGE